jgi:predicted ATP-dependent endonuclease of OLD family
MIVEIQNIGKIKKAKIDLSKNLIVFTGRNNSGKTWVSYVLYSLFKSKIDKKNNNKNKFFGDELFLGLDEENPIKSTKYNIKELVKYFNGILTKDYIENLPNYFANSKIDFSKFSIALSDLYLKGNRILLFEIDNKKIISIEILKSDEDFTVNMVYHPDELSNVIPIYFSKNKSIRLIRKKIDDLTILKWLLSFSETTFIPAERVGISVFSTDISANRIESESVVDYQLPIKDALQDWIRIPNFVNRTKDNVFTKLAKQIENDILGGGLSVSEGGIIQFEIDENNSLSYYNTASNIKSLASLIFYLKYYAKADGILFIDEPELNLHPDNQRKIARYLSIISNLGIKVFVSTHSDYIIREFNNLIMFSKKHSSTENLMTELGYSKNETLKKEDVSAYYFDKGLVSELEVSETGFEVSSIDETIEKQNEILNKLYFSLFEE